MTRIVSANIFFIVYSCIHYAIQINAQYKVNKKVYRTGNMKNELGLKLN